MRSNTWGRRYAFLFVVVAVAVAVVLVSAIWWMTWSPAETYAERGTEVRRARVRSRAGDRSTSDRSLAVSSPILRAVDEAAEARVSVVSAPTGLALAGATIRFGDDVGVWTDSRETDAQGVAWLPHGSAVALAILSEGHIPLVGVFDLTDKSRDFVLEIGGRVEIQFRDGLGYPCSGVRVRLLAPMDGVTDERVRWQKLAGFRADQSPLHELSTVLVADVATDDAGISAWSGLPPGFGYRWGLLSQHHLEMTPPFEVSAREFSGGSIRSRDIPLGVSGRFGVEAGEVTRIRVTVETSARVTGIVRGRFGGAKRAPVIKLFHKTVREAASETSPRFVMFDAESDVFAEEGGGFRFQNVRPGDKRISYLIEEEGQRFSFGNLEFSVMPAEQKDLGSLWVSEGGVLGGIVECEDSLGTSVCATEVFDTEVVPEVVLSVHLTADQDRSARSVSDMISVVMDRPFELHGLPAGEFFCNLRMVPGSLPPRRDPESRVRWPSLLETTLTEEMVRVTNAAQSSQGVLTVNMVFKVERMIGQSIRARFPREVVPCRCEVWLRHRETSTSFRVALRPPRSNRATATWADGEVNLPRGTFDVLVHTFSQTEPENTASLFAISVLEVGGAAQTMEIELGTAASLRGQVLDDEASPMSGHRIFFTLDPWGSDENEGGREWPYVTKTDSNGRFLIRGVVPFANLEGLFLDPNVEMGAAGAEVEAVFELQE